MKNDSNDYVIRVLKSPEEVNAAVWNALLAAQPHDSPFMRHEYLSAMHDSKSAVPKTGWTPRFITLWRGDELQAACALYRKSHSYGEYVFDWAWANAYEQHGLPYYPKATVAPPFTPVPGARLLARDAASRLALVRTLVEWCGDEELSSLHLLFCSDEDVDACKAAGLMLRHTVQFHWTNLAPTLGTDVSSLPPEGVRFALGRPGGETLAAARYASFDAFLASLNQEKRKKTPQEQRKVADAGVTFRWSLGTDISAQDWVFFYRCYERTYLEHGNAPYLTPAFFARMASTMPENWLLFIAERGGTPIASSLIAVQAAPSAPTSGQAPFEKVAFGRYWGALERVDCLHFDACYYQPLKWCIEHGYSRFEGGAQGEHKMARALLPVKTTSAHWLAHPSFADAVERFLEREGQGINNYMEHLEHRSPFRQPD
ncbi:MAG: N-acetyltransferase [Burkholderiaceae bacterium]|nr:N-acetyltransferase [Burkholderiaceae bacterium]